MKKLGLFSLVVSMTLSVTFAQARSIQQEIDEEARMTAVTPAATSSRTTFNRVVPKESLVHLVPIGGMTFSNFKGGNENYSFSTTSGYEAGVGILVGRGDLQFETGVMYAERGSKESYRMGITAWDINYNNKYVELPLMARYNIMNNSDVRMYIKGGAIMAVLQNSTGNLTNTQNYNAAAYQAQAAYYSYGVNTYNSSLMTDSNTKSSFASTDLRWALGLGGQVRMTRSLAWTVEADYQNSTGNISTSQPNAAYGSTQFNLTMETYGVKTGLVWSL